MRQRGTITHWFRCWTLRRSWGFEQRACGQEGAEGLGGGKCCKQNWRADLGGLTGKCCNALGSGTECWGVQDHRGRAGHYVLRAGAVASAALRTGATVRAARRSSRAHTGSAVPASPLQSLSVPARQDARVSAPALRQMVTVAEPGKAALRRTTSPAAGWVHAWLAESPAFQVVTWAS